MSLSVDPRLDYGFDLAQVAADLEVGMVLEERTGRQGSYYVFRSAYHQVFLNPAIGRDSRVAIARVSSIKDGDGLGRRESVRPRRVVFCKLWDEESCDLRELKPAFDEALDQVRRRRIEKDKADHTLAGGTPETSAHGLMQRRVREHYRPLQTVFKVLAARSALTGTVEVTAVVVDADAERVELELSSVARLSEDRVVKVHIDSEQYEVPILVVDGKACEIPQPRRALIRDERVKLVQRDRFAMAKHDRALTSFLSGNVEGNWDHLATLLTNPENLAPAVPPPQPIAYLSGIDLNDEQKSAVNGALATPHAFLIQGPPGTGKTTVIMELVLQLVARGERVLLLAPMHVAVDEVLRRIGDRPEVFPVRLAFDDSKVSEDLQRFLLQRISTEYLRRTRTPERSKAQEWRRRLDHLAALRGLLTSHVQAAETLAVAAAQESAAAESYRVWEAWFHASSSEVTERVKTAERTVDRISGAAQESDHRAIALRTQVAAASTGRRVGSWLAGLIGRADELGRLRRAVEAATADAKRLHAAHRDWLRECDVARQALQALEAARDNDGRQRYTRWQLHRRELDAAGQALNRAAKASGRPSHPAPHASLIQVGSEISVLERRISLEQRWFDLVQPQEPGRLTRELRQAANVVCCTTTGVGNKVLEGLDFDTLIVDEASRVIDSEFLMSAIHARRWVMVGDEHQLPPYVEPADEHHLHALAALHKAGDHDATELSTVVAELARIWHEDEEMHAFRSREVLRQAERCLSDRSWPDRYRGLVSDTWRQFDPSMLKTTLDHLVRSLFDRVVAACPADLRQALVEQRRMIEPIAELVKDPVYGGCYRTPVSKLGLTPFTSTAFTHPVTLLDTSSYGEKARHQQYKNGCFNTLEVDWVVATCRRLERELGSIGSQPITVSILTFYRRQAILIREALGWPSCRAFRSLRFRVVDSIDKIQGQEADLVIVSFCRAYPGRAGPRRNAGLWLQDIRRLNVACTRARRGLILVGHGDTLRRLSGADPAERFYANLFRLLDSNADGYGLVKDL
ncbi:AAA family ATPase [Actinoplanes bogorensis]|uniref:AAA family ATPase n=1 Tax=Paractinoplanes bogorensis TaxID=1610840 RepID=A0ABS5Z3D2_9ACTN|nr:AAA domain-containing protein [Actinoplanes bogorensis]MBU2670178.1 AAA family ATPase [Actinoplanes bogorensis]